MPQVNRPLRNVDSPICVQPGVCGLRDLAVEVVPNSTLQSGGALAQRTSQVIKIVTGSEPEFADEILGRRLEISVVLCRVFLLGSAEVCVGRDGSCSLETL